MTTNEERERGEQRKQEQHTGKQGDTKYKCMKTEHKIDTLAESIILFHNFAECMLCTYSRIMNY